jgi:hypothetical protein
MMPFLVQYDESVKPFCHITQETETQRAFDHYKRIDTVPYLLDVEAAGLFPIP